MGCCGNKTNTTNEIEMGETDQGDGGAYGEYKVLKFFARLAPGHYIFRE